MKFNSTNLLFPCISLIWVCTLVSFPFAEKEHVFSFYNQLPSFQIEPCYFPSYFSNFFLFWLSRPFCSIAAYLALGLYLAVSRVPLHEDSTSYVRCLSPSEVLYNEISRLTDCFVSCSSGGYIKYILFLVCKGGGRGCKNVTLFF